jgi:hypothetical protein
MPNDIHLYEAFKNLCLQQRRKDSQMSPENFRKTLVRLFQETSESELINLAIDVESEMIGTIVVLPPIESEP